MRIVWSFKLDGTAGAPPRPPLAWGPGVDGGTWAPEARPGGGPPRPTVDVAVKGCDVAHVATQCSAAALRVWADKIDPASARRRTPDVIRTFVQKSLSKNRQVETQCSMEGGLRCCPSNPEGHSTAPIRTIRSWICSAARMYGLQPCYLPE